MRVWMCPAASSARRIAPMRPSIMSDGATMSAPASRMRDGLLDERVDGLVVDDVAGVVDEAVLAVRRERIERDVGDDAEFGKRLLERAHGALREAVGIPRFARIEALRLGRRDRKQRERRNAERVRLAGDAQRARRSKAARRRASTAPARASSRPSRTNTGRIRSVGGQVGLAHQRAREGIAAHAARAGMRIRHGDVARKLGKCALYARALRSRGGARKMNAPRVTRRLTGDCIMLGAYRRREGGRRRYSGRGLDGR